MKRVLAMLLLWIPACAVAQGLHMIRSQQSFPEAMAEVAPEI